VISSREVVVDRLRHADDRKLALLVQPSRDAERVLAADRHERVQPEQAEVATTLSAPPSTLNGFVREVPRIVPPRGMIPEIRSLPSSCDLPSTKPFHPSWTPTTSTPRSIECRVTARMTAFSPGQSPPPVRIPSRFTIRVSGRSAF